MIAAELLIRLIRQAINEASTTGDTLSEEVDVALIDFAMMAAPSVIMEVAPAYHTTVNMPGHKSDSHFFSIRPDGKTIIRIPLPDDFCRFVSLRAETWVYPASILYSDGNAQFAAQYSTEPGIGAGPATPLVFLSSELDSNGELKSFIVGHSLDKPENFVLSYVGTPVVSMEEVMVDARLQNALAYYAAALYLQSILDVNGSKAALDMAMNFIQKLNNIVTL